MYFLNGVVLSNHRIMKRFYRSSGLQSTITVRAEYVQDFLMAIVAGLVIGAACVGGGFIYYKKFRRMKPGPDEDSENVVDGAETDTATTTAQEEAPIQDLKPIEDECFGYSGGLS